MYNIENLPNESCKNIIEIICRIAKFHKLDDAILYPSGFDSNAGFFEACLTAEDAIISDELNHASIIDGIRLCKARRLRYKHMNMEILEQMLQDSQDCRLRVIVTDGIFSMDGDIAPLDKIHELAKRYNAFIFVGGESMTVDNAFITKQSIVVVSRRNIMVITEGRIVTMTTMMVVKSAMI